MNHLKKFESFIVPKPVRRFMPGWSDEDIALQVLKELKSMKGNHQEISSLKITYKGSSGLGSKYEFNLDGFDFLVDYYVSMRAYGVDSGTLKMNGKPLSVSTEVCKKIMEMIKILDNTTETELTEYDKKDFRIRMKNKK